MAKTTRTKEIWHIPKRGSVHQAIYLVKLLTFDKFINKAWSSGKQEMIASEMGKSGLTQSGGALSHQSVRTLLANLPKYLGFVFIDDSSTPSRIFVTEAGYQLVDFHKIEDVPRHKNLSEYALSGDLVETSEVFKQQMAKLIITNPVIFNDCQKILVFPFRMTLRILLKLGYLDKEEIAYILFHTKSEDEYELLIQRIENFRSLPPQSRQDEIDAYKKTEEGGLTLVKAPTAGYYMYLCCSTGLCEKTDIKVNKVKENALTGIRLSNSVEAQNILDRFSKAEIYDFKTNVQLWMDYFSNPSILNPPFDAQIHINKNQELLVTIYQEKKLIGSTTLATINDVLTVPVFENVDYQISAYNISNGKKVFNNTVQFNREKRQFFIDIDQEYKETILTPEQIPQTIYELIEGKFEGFDETYYKKLSTLREILGKNFIDNRRRGGRLEYLFFELLKDAKEKNIIDEVFWYGKESELGVYEPAPGGKDGSPDLIIEVDNLSIVLELTTIRGIRGQWNSSEASSVPDHIFNYMKRNPKRKVIGIFSAPSIHDQLAKNLLLNAREGNVAMLFLPCVEFADYIQSANRKEFLDFLQSETTDQLTK